MSNRVNRRDVLKAAGVAAAGVLASPLLRWADAQEGGKPFKVLFFTRSQGFQHAAITRPRNNPDQLGPAEQLMVDWGKKHNFEVTATKDGSIFTEQGLAPFDVIMFYTTGLLDQPIKDQKLGEINNHPMPPGGKEVFLKAIADGKGFVGVHSSTDTFHSPPGTVDPYIDMIGGEFVVHHSQEACKILAADHNWPAIPGLEDFTKYEEWYILKNLAPDMHVLLVQDTKSMKQAQYNSLNPYPETWARHYNKGRVFYTSMGHRCATDAKDGRGDVWASDIFQKVLMGGLQWAAGNIGAEVKPNIREVTPGAMIRKSDAV